MSLLDKKNKGGKSLRFPSDKVADHDDYMAAIRLHHDDRRLTARS